MPTAEHPEQGSLEDLIPRLTAYVSTSDPDWAATLEGVSEEELDNYCRLAGLSDAGLQLPATYLSWARAAGRRDGGLLSDTLRAWVAVPKMVDFYKDCHKFEPQFIEADLPVVISWKIGDDISFDLRGEAPEPSLRETGSGEDMGPYADSWEQVLFQCAFKRGEPRRWPSLATYGASQDSLEQSLERSREHGGPNRADLLLSALLDELGLQTLWISDPRHVFALGDQLSVAAVIGPTGGLVSTVYGADPKRVQAVGSSLAGGIGASPGALEQWR